MHNVSDFCIAEMNLIFVLDAASDVVADQSKGAAAQQQKQQQKQPQQLQQPQHAQQQQQQHQLANTGNVKEFCSDFNRGICR